MAKKKTPAKSSGDHWTKKKVVGVYLTAELHRKAMGRAKALELSLSRYVEYLIRKDRNA